MNYLKALSLIHDAVKPAFYLEIGCREGSSLELARCSRLAIDPDPNITCGLTWPTRMFRETSDAFFARPDARAILGQAPDLAFIDGMHWVEFALRDFMNIEAHAKPETVVVIDDVMPGDMAWATRERRTQAWTGDVYRMIPVLRHYRPDLEIAVFDAQILHFDKGLAVISNLDPNNRVLWDAYDTIAAELEDGRFVETSTEALREHLGGRPSDGLNGYIASVVRRHAPPVTGRSLSERYLELMKAALVNALYREDQYRLIYLRKCLAGQAEFDKAVYLDIGRRDAEGFAAFQASSRIGYPHEKNLQNLGFSHTMMGHERLNSLHECLDHVRIKGIPGDLMECGVWRGGGCIFMAGYLRAYGMTGRRVVLADSFEGLPKPSLEQDAKLDLSKKIYPELAVDQETVEANFRLYDLLDDTIVFLKGWFRDTLPMAPVEQIALLRLDGDLYESTMDALTALYDKVPVGGVVIIDDFGALKACEQAVRDFFDARGERFPEIKTIDWTGVYWIKTSPKPAAISP